MFYDKKIIDGKIIADNLLDKIKNNIQNFKNTIKIVVIIVGESPSSLIYVNKKAAMAKKLGIESEIMHLDTNISEEELIGKINSLNKDKNINAILVQLPLPKHINKNKIIASISPLKDVDGFHYINIGKLFSNDPDAIIPCTPLGCYLLLNNIMSDQELAGKKVCIIGRSNIVGKPLAQLLLNKNATVTIVHSKTLNLKNETAQADIVIVAIGKPEFLTAEYIKEGAIVLDVGINRIENSKKIVGDVNFASVAPKAKFITKVPGGVGPMTIACLMANTLKLAELQNEYFN